MCQSNKQTFEDVSALFSLSELVSGPSNDYLDAKFDELIDELSYVEYSRPAIYQSYVVDPYDVCSG